MSWILTWQASSTPPSPSSPLWSSSSGPPTPTAGRWTKSKKHENDDHGLNWWGLTKSIEDHINIIHFKPKSVVFFLQNKIVFKTRHFLWVLQYWFLSCIDETSTPLYMNIVQWCTIGFCRALISISLYMYMYMLKTLKRRGRGNGNISRNSENSERQKAKNAKNTTSTERGQPE